MTTQLICISSGKYWQVEHRKASKGRACTGFCVTAIVLKVIAQAVTELDNKTTHRQPPVLCKVATISRVVIPLWRAGIKSGCLSA